MKSTAPFSGRAWPVVSLAAAVAVTIAGWHALAADEDNWIFKKGGATPPPLGLSPGTGSTSGIGSTSGSGTTVGSSVTSGAGSASAVVTPSQSGITIASGSQKIQATKRGVCENHLSAQDFVALSKGVSWYYNWAANTSDVPPPNAPMEFVPMAWGHGGDPAAVASYLGGHKTRAVLAINEPNLKGQAFITPEATAAFYKKVKEVADAHKIPVVGPNMALGSGPNESIKAPDPLTNKDTVYNWFGSFLQAFSFFAKKDNTPTGMVGTHSYKDMSELKWAVTKSFELSGNKPVWVTEFAFWNAKDDKDELSYLKTAVEYLESSRQVAGYAWFKERVDKNPKLSLLEKEAGKLTPLGEEYIKLPSHSANVFYRVPGALDAGKYVTNENMTLRSTTDVAGDYDMVSAGAGWIDYNLYVETPGTYAVKLRVSGSPGEISILQDGRFLGSAECTEPGWQTVETSVALHAGVQVLRFKVNGQTLHSLDFVMKSEVAMK